MHEILAILQLDQYHNIAGTLAVSGKNIVIVMIFLVALQLIFVGEMRPVRMGLPPQTIMR